jgi:SAM-dependent methyltransferase
MAFPGARTSSIRALLGKLVKLARPSSRPEPAKPTSYQEYHSTQAAHLLGSVAGARVLVVGANTGNDCRLFVEMGVGEVVGLDVVDEIGTDYRHERVTYLQKGIEESGLEAGSFDLVFAVATMEHVHALEAGFSEMARLTRPDGVIYSVAAPLWNSAYGHHMGCFIEQPWIHLLYERDDLIRFALENGIDGERGYTIDLIVDYMLNPQFFNRRPARDYLQACSKVEGVEILSNEMHRDPESRLEHEFAKRALARGYEPSELLSVTHVFTARRLPPNGDA